MHKQCSIYRGETRSRLQRCLTLRVSKSFEINIGVYDVRGGNSHNMFRWVAERGGTLPDQI